MKSISLNYYKEGIMIVNNRLKDSLSIRYQSQTLESTRFTTKIQQSYHIEEIIGFLNINSTLFVIVVNEKKDVCCIEKKTIYQVETIELFPILPLENWKSMNQVTKEEMTKVKTMLNDCELYYSYGLDITLTCQGRYEMLFPDTRFFWNEHLVEMYQMNYEHWIVMFIDGFIKSIPLGNSQNETQYILMSRRDKSRAGLRFSSRGADSDGNVSNFVETEQIIVNSNYITSFTQIRGNIPLIWKTDKNDVFSPKGKYVEDLRQNSVILKHFNDLNEIYGDVTVVSLLNNNTHEKELHDMYELYVKTNEIPVKYVPFDFHSICAGNRYELIELLIDKITEELKRDGFFYLNKQTNKATLQTGIVRTNCIDCLDRTNVVQSTIAKHLLVKQLNVFENQENPLPYEALLSIPEQTLFMNIWADHANIMSYRYTQTDAMKTDFTRKGKRELKGMLNDGLICVQRAVISIKTDQYQKPQETLDLIMGLLKYDNCQMLKSCDKVNLCIQQAKLIQYDNKTTCDVHLHLTTEKFVEFSYDTKLTREILLSKITRCEINQQNAEEVSLWCSYSSQPFIYKFNSILESYKFLLGILDVIEMFQKLDPSISKLHSSARSSRSSSLSVRTSTSKNSNSFVTAIEMKNTPITFATWDLGKHTTQPTTQMIQNFVKEIEGNIIDLVLSNIHFEYETDVTNSVSTGIQLVIDIMNMIKQNKSHTYHVLSIKELNETCHCLLVTSNLVSSISNLTYSKLYFAKEKETDTSKIIISGNGFTFNCGDTSFACMNVINKGNSDEGKQHLYLTNETYNDDISYFNTTHFFINSTCKELKTKDISLLQQSEVLNETPINIIWYRNLWKVIHESSKDIAPFEYPKHSLIETPVSLLTMQQVWNATLCFLEIPKQTNVSYNFNISIQSMNDIIIQSQNIQCIAYSKCLQKVYKYSFQTKNIGTTDCIMSMELNPFNKLFLSYGYINLSIVTSTMTLRSLIPLHIIRLKTFTYPVNLYLNGSMVGTMTVNIGISVRRKSTFSLGGSLLTQK